MIFGNQALPPTAEEIDQLPSLKRPVTRRRLVKHLGVAAAIGGLAVTASPALALASDDNHANDFKSWSRPSGYNVLLLHGAYATSASWNSVIDLLNQEGHNVLAVDLPLTSLADDVAVARQALATAAFAGPTIVAGHSYAGAVMTEAADKASNVVGLVYATAFAPLKGESIVDLGSRFPAPPGNSFVFPSYRNGFVWLDPAHYPQIFCPDVSLTMAREMAVTQKPIVPDCFAQKAGGAAWQQIPSWCLISKNDMAINPDVERFMAKRMKAPTIEVNSSHASPVSHPREVAALIKAAIKSHKKA